MYVFVLSANAAPLESRGQHANPHCTSAFSQDDFHPAVGEASSSSVLAISSHIRQSRY